MRITIARFSVVETLSASVPLRLALCAWGLWFLVPIANACSDEPIGFNSTIRPILSEKCFFCHGPDEKTRGADLRLDLREDAIEAGAILPGDAANSQLLIRIHEDAPEQRMPPPESKLTELTSEEKQLLRDWISQGAIYEKHWAFEPIGVQDTPRSDLASLIDSIVQSKLEIHGLTRAPRADRYTLARRAALDITGLPPTREVLDAFLNDSAPEAWGSYIDKLLASPHYGERMASDWLDIARYADSFGFQVDRDIEVWPWRDWVINAFNSNKPYDQFIVEQLAGDMLPNASQDQILATTFNRLHQQESEGGSVEEEYRVEYVSDRLHTFGTAFLGLTLECARCHDHKFDPISQKEYYQLFAFFQNIDEAGLYSYFTHSQPTPTLAFKTPEQSSQLDQLRTKIEQLSTEWAELYDRDIAERLQSSSTALTPPSIRPDFYYLSLDEVTNHQSPDLRNPEVFATVQGENKSVPGKLGNGVELSGDDPVKTTIGNFQRHEPFSVSLWLNTPDHKERAVIFHRSRAWTDAASRGYELLLEEGKLKWSLIHFWPGNAISIRTRSEIPQNAWTHVSVTYDGSSLASGLALFVDGEQVEFDVIKDRLTKEITGGGGDFIDLGERFRDRGFQGGIIDEFRVFKHALTPWEARQVYSSNQIDAAMQSLDPRTDPNASPKKSPTERLAVEHLVRVHNERLNQLDKELQAARIELYRLEDSLVEIMAMRELPTPKPAYVLIRGEYNTRGEEVFANTPAILPELKGGTQADRLALARWTVSPENPLTARVIVNRLWQSIFGYGLVKTSEDFGSQGSRPAHPELLDALAADFIAGGWDTKKLIRSILMSETYQQNSFSSPEQIEADPENALLARGPRFRLPAEMIRDSSLANAQLLNRKIGGPSVVTYELTESFKPSDLVDNGDRYRRSLYTRWRRTGPPPAMISFDAPRRAVCTPKRERTNTPLQALILLNNPQVIEASIQLADRLRESHGHQVDSEIAKQAFLAILGRPATDKELRISEQLLREQAALFNDQPDRITELTGTSKYKPTLPADAKFAALTLLCHTLFNHDGAVIKR